MPRQFPNIPGVLVTYRDRSIVIPETSPQTGNVTIIDYGLWGPVNEPITIGSMDQVTTLYGSVIGAFGDSNRVEGYNGNAIAKAAEEVFNSGNRNLTIVRADFGGLQAYTEVAFAAGTALSLATEDVAETEGVAATDDDAGTRATIPLTGHDLGIVQGTRMWCTAGTLYQVLSVRETATDEATPTDYTLVTLAAADLTPSGTARNWYFGPGWRFAGAFPGAIGNSCTFRIDATLADGAVTVVIYLDVPDEFGGYSVVYSSEQYSTFGSITYRMNRDLADIMSIGFFGTSGTALISEAIEIVDVADDGDSYALGAAVTVADVTKFNAMYQAGTDVDTTLFPSFNIDPEGFGVDRAVKHKWYVDVLGNVNDTADEAKLLPLIRGQEIGIVIVPSLFIDDMIDPDTGAIEVVDSTAGKTALQYLLDFVHQQNTDGITTKLIIGASPLLSTTVGDVKSRVTLLKANGFMDGELTNSDGNTETIDAGRYLNVAAGPHVVVQNRDIGTYTASGATQLAALKTITTPDTSATRKALSGISALGYAFTFSQLSDLSGGQGPKKDGGAYTCFMIDGGRALVNYAVTASSRSSDFNKDQNVNVVQAAGSAVRTAVKPFIGNPFGPEQYSAMSTAIQSALDGLVDIGIIAGARGYGYDFIITQTTVDAILGEATVSLSVRPNFELDWVTVDVKLRS